MIDYKRMKAQNTSISAIIAIQDFPLGRRRLATCWAREEKQSGRKQSWEEFLVFAESLRPKGINAAETVLRVVVYENPYARLPLTRKIFTGPLDERFGPDGHNITRLFAGDHVKALETEEAANPVENS
jgi:hypothetical protein